MAIRHMWRMATGLDNTGLNVLNADKWKYLCNQLVKAKRILVSVLHLISRINLFLDSKYSKKIDFSFRGSLKTVSN